jgi:heptaprenyl diphosphate synthase
MKGRQRVIDVSNILEFIEDVKEQLTNKLQHKYMKNIISTPSIDEDKLLLLCSFLEPFSTAEKPLHAHAVSVMLVQIALDTHDLVSTQKIPSETAPEKERQLTVIAGDYYSGLYYFLLSQAGDITFIQRLATAIKKTNISKMFLYRNEVKTLEEMIHHFTLIETAVFTALTEYFEQPKWTKLFLNVLLTKRFLYEKQCLLNDEKTLFTETFKRYMKRNSINKREGIAMLDSYIETNRNALIDGDELTKSEEMKKYIKSLLIHETSMGRRVNDARI